MSRIAQIFSDPLSILYTLPAVLIGLTVHEWAHAFAAYKLGDPTARDMGRMTLNPFAHIDWIGFISLLLLGFGWAKPVMVNPMNMRGNPRTSMAIVALAGPLSNFVMAVIAGLIFRIGLVDVNAVFSGSGSGLSVESVLLQFLLTLLLLFLIQLVCIFLCLLSFHFSPLNLLIY